MSGEGLCPGFAMKCIRKCNKMRSATTLCPDPLGGGRGVTVLPGLLAGLRGGTRESMDIREGLGEEEKTRWKTERSL